MFSAENLSQGVLRRDVRAEVNIVVKTNEVSKKNQSVADILGISVGFGRRNSLLYGKESQSAGKLN